MLSLSDLNHWDLSLRHQRQPDILYAAKELSSFMSKRTHGSLQRLKKLIGYLRATPTYCLVLETPIPGQGKWKSSELTWVLECFTDAHWSSNQRRSRSTNCGIHLLCGSFIFGSSRTQRVVSLSSCESELHAMISTEADALFLKHCIEFLTGAKVEHQLYTDFSAARQLALENYCGLKTLFKAVRQCWYKSLQFGIFQT